MTNSDKALLRRAASIWGRLGGSVSSEAKAAAARENGKKGGRPRKSGGVEGAKSPPLKPHDPPKPRGARPSKQKKSLTR